MPIRIWTKPFMAKLILTVSWMDLKISNRCHFFPCYRLRMCLCQIQFLSVFCCIMDHLPTLRLECQLRVISHGSVAWLTSFGVQCDYDLLPIGWLHLGMREHGSLSHLLIWRSVGDTDVAINFLEMATCLSSPGVVAEFSDLISQEQRVWRHMSRSWRYKRPSFEVHTFDSFHWRSQSLRLLETQHTGIRLSQWEKQLTNRNNDLLS